MIVPYDFREITLSDGTSAYFIYVYFLFDGKSAYPFFKQSELLDNALFAKECGLPSYTFYKKVLITPSTFPEIFSELHDYVSCPDNH